MSSNLSPEPPSPTEATRPATVISQSGGVDIDAQRDVTIAGDVVGRDKIVVIQPQLRVSRQQKHQQQEREGLLKKVEKYWIKDFLEHTLHEAVLIELGLEERRDAVQYPWETEVQSPLMPRRALPPGTKLIDVFTESNGGLLILGAPGSGKTTVLLDLAREMLACARADGEQPIPVVFHLTSWAEKGRPFDKWLLEELRNKYHVDEAMSRVWIKDKALLLLLDGLDEVRPDRRIACVNAINQFRRDHGSLPMALCCRVADYEELSVQLNLGGAIELQPLTPEQVVAYLQSILDETDQIKNQIQGNNALLQLAQSPLMLNVMVLAFRGKGVFDLNSFDSVVELRDRIFNDYVQQMFRRRAGLLRYPPEKSLKWLSFLAKGLADTYQSVFAPISIQPNWQRTHREKRIYSATYALTESLLVSVSSLLLISLIPFSSFHTPDFLAAEEILSFFILALIVYRLPKAIGVSPLATPGELLKVRLGPVLRAMRRYILIVVIAAVLVPLMWMPWFMTNERLLMLDMPSLYLRLYPPFAIIFIVPPVIGVGFVRTASHYIKVSAHQQRHTLPEVSAKLSLFYALVFTALGLMVGTAVSIWLSEATGLSLPVSALFGLYYGLGSLWMLGGSAAMAHYLLRVVLVRFDRLPWNLKAFFDDAVDRTLLLRTGFGYMFAHRMLRDYFATQGRDAPALHSQGIAYLCAGDTDNAVRNLEAAVELEPNNVVYLNELCWIGALTGYSKGKLTFADQAVKLAPRIAIGVVRDTRGLVRVLNGDYQGAIDDFEFYVKSKKKHHQIDATCQQREIWIAELRQGRNPVDETALRQSLAETIDLYQG